jgi:hypothetical protein
VHSWGAVLDKQLHPAVYGNLCLNHNLEKAAQSHLKDGGLICLAIVQAFHASYEAANNIQEASD